MHKIRRGARISDRVPVALTFFCIMTKSVANLNLSFHYAIPFPGRTERRALRSFLKSQASHVPCFVAAWNQCERDMQDSVAESEWSKAAK